jgi:acyl transferase domain-containing protein
VTEKIAIIGFGGRFPGAPAIDEFWDLLVAGRSGLTRFTDAELAARGVPPSLRRHPGYVPVGGVIDGYDQFDPVPFGIGEAEAEVLDPQQRVFLECAWHALEHAGHGGGRSAGTVGVFAGAALSAYLLTNLAHRFDPVGGADPAGSLSLHTANVAAYLPMRTAYRLGLTGPALSVGATCATSLVAVHVAVQSLLGGECDTALAGGVSLRDPLGTGYLSVPDGPFSSDGNTRPYSARATGTVFTQGAGVVVLRRLSDALADGDFIHAVILGSAVANDGAERAGFTAPSPSGQARTIAEALAVSGVEPREISYIEGHGTGTILGDPIEVQALRRVFGPADDPWCALGSVKGNIGHADSAAGIAGLIKTVLALREGVLPASLHAAEPNPELKLDGSAFRLVTRTEPWQADGVRRAGVSSFGMGGTNCHVILEAPPAPALSASARPAPDDRAHLLLVSGATARACRDTAHVLAGGIAARNAPAELADIAHTLAGGRIPMAVRAAAVAGPADDVAAALRAAVPAPPVEGKPRVVFAFPGGGAQFAGMAARLHADEPVFAAAVDRLSGVFRPLLDADPRDVLLAAPGDERIRALVRDPVHGLPALFIASVAMAELLGHYGVRPDAVLGHSAGEYAAATVAGVLSEQDAALLVARRSALMSGLPSGAMLAVAMSEDRVRGLLRRHPGVDLAAVNGPDACAVSGPTEAVSALRDELEAAGLPARDVAIDVAAHSRLVEPGMPELRAVTGGLSPRPPRIPLVTTVTGTVATEAELADPEHWVRHLRGTVRFAAALENALADGPAVVVQAGPGAGLATLAAARGVSGVRAAVTTYPAPDADPDGRPTVLHALGQLWTHGADIDHPATTGTPRRRVPLPGYAFTRRRFWAEPPAGVARLPGASAAEPGPDEPFQVPAWSQLPPQSIPLTLNGQWWLVLGDGTRADAVRAEFAARGAVTRDPTSDADWAALSGIISLLGCDQPAAGQEQAQLKHVLREYQRLAAAVPVSLEPRPLPFLQVTIGGERVIGDETVSPPASAVGGLPRVLAQEVPALRWRTLDLQAGVDGPAAARIVLTEITDLTANARELAVRGTRRWIRHWQPWHPPLDDAPAGTGAEPVVVVIGGLGRVGLALAERLCAAGRPRLVLASRSGLPPEDEAAGDPVLARRLDVVRRLRAEGCQVRVAAVDAADAPAVRELLAGVAAEHGRIDLVVYAPVIVELTQFAEWDDGAVDTVPTPKVAGALALRDAVGGLDAVARPASVLLMASAAGAIGGFGLSAYVAGSRFLDGLAVSLDGEQARTRSTPKTHSRHCSA